MASVVAASPTDAMHMPSIRKSAKGGWRAAIFIIFLEVAERFSYYGVAGNLINYLTNVLGQPTAEAAKNVNIWIGVSSVFPLLGALIADSYMGRYKTILLSSIIFLLGLVLLIISVSAVPTKLHQELFFISLYIICVGEGGHKPCVQTFAADQFDEELPEEKAEKSSFFNWWYLGIVCGATTAILVVIYVQESVGWGVGYGMLALAVAISFALFLIGSRTFRQQAPIGSPFTRVAQVVVAAARKRHLSDSLHGRGICYDDDHGTKFRAFARTAQFRFLDKAMMVDGIDASNEKRDPWRLCSINQVEEVKLLLRLIPIWASCSLFAVVIAQLSTYFTKQGSTMIRSFGPKFHFPAASFQVFTGLTILTAIPIYERIAVPLARNITGHRSGFSMLQRIGVGLFLSILTMVVAALVEAKRVRVARETGLIDAPKATVPMAIWWLLPQYMLCGLCDVFTIVGMQELFYDQMPEEMRSMGAAAFISVVGFGNLISSGIITVTQEISSRYSDKWLGNNLNRAHLDYFYWVLAGLSVLNLGFYVCVSKGFIYKKIECLDSNNEREMAIQVHDHEDKF